MAAWKNNEVLQEQCGFNKKMEDDCWVTFQVISLA